MFYSMQSPLALYRAFRAANCVFHAIRPPVPRASGHWFHDDPATLSTAIRPGQAERSDAGKRTLRRLGRWGQPLFLPHGFSVYSQPVGVVDQSIQNGVRQGGIANAVMPVLDG